MRRIFVLLSVLVVAMSPSVSAVAQESASTPSAGATEVDGMFDIGGRSLYLNCLGSGSPTVILEAGADADSAYWGALQDRIADMTRVCRYDRAGTGESTAAREQSSSVGSLAADLQALLDEAAVPGPYVLVAHSCGGLVIRQFAADHPDDVAGLVMIDACVPQWLVETSLPPDFTAFLAGGNREQVDYIAGATDVVDLPLPKVPAAVLANWETDVEWLGWQAGMAGELETLLIVVPGAGHEIHLTRPEPVLEAILDVLIAARGGMATPAP
jgi:pimeloyl-ACP methyl ester carboxylesterase